MESGEVCSTIATWVDDKLLLVEVSLLEEKQRQRVANLREMSEHLEGVGFTVGAVFEGGLAAAAERLGIVAERVDVHHSISSVIISEITPFDSELASDYITRRNEIQKNPGTDENDRLQQLESEIEAVSDSFRSRLTRLQERVDAWVSEGYAMPIEGAVPPEDLLIWEMRMAEIEQAIEAHDKTWERIESGLLTWPEHRLEASGLRGDLESIEDLVALADSLEQLTRACTGEGRGLMDWWSDHGFSMALWQHRFDDDPRLALEEFKAYVPTLEEAKRIIDGIERLDVSMGGGDEAWSHIVALRDAVLESETSERARQWLEARRRRNLRHRVMLEDEWCKLVSLGKADAELAHTTGIDELSLADFESLVATIDRTGHNESELVQATGDEVAASRLEKQLLLLIENWHSAGWDTSGVEAMIEDNPLAFGRRLGEIRARMDNHEMLRQRYQALPVERSDEIITRLELDMRKPDKLAALWSDLPQIAATLADLPSVDGERSWQAWQPGEMQRPTLIPHILSTVTSDGTIDQEVEALEAAIIAMADEIEGGSPPVNEMPHEEKTVSEIPDGEPFVATSEPAEESGETPEVIPEVTEDVTEVKIPPTIEMAVEELAASFSGSESEHEPEVEPEAESEHEPGVGVEPGFEATSAAEDKVKFEPKEESESDFAPESKSKSIPDSADELAQEGADLMGIQYDEYASMNAPEYESKGEPDADVAVSSDAGTEDDDWSIFSSAIEDFVEIIGLDDELSGDWPSELPGLRRALSPYVGLAPRDTRIDRLLRLVLRAIPPDDAGQEDIEKSVLVIVKLSEFARKLSAWSRERLLYRNLSSSGALLADGEALGLALERIPGPGIAIPLEADDISLPRFEDYDDLLRQVEKLRGAINLPAAGNIVAASA
ncbi:MAG: hypothetical protein CXX80_08895 [Methanobacteriota archaeon]|nr:MAG: hypothetical protein CXX80_08895 [Euryarchaeota archaeon]